MKKSIFWFITAFISVPVILFVFIACAFLSAYIYEQKVETLEAEINNLADYIESTFTNQYNRVANSAQTPELLAFAQDPGNQQKRNEAQAILLNTFNTSDNASEVTLISADGTVLITSDLNTPDNVSDTRLFQEIKATQLPYVTTDIQERLPLITIGFPIVYDGQLVAIYRRTTPLNYVPIFCENLNFDEENIYILTNESEAIIYNPDGNYELVPEGAFSNSSSSDVLTMLESKEKDSDTDEGIIEFDYGSAVNVGAYRIIKNLNWVCMISESRALIQYDLNLFQFITFIIAILYIIIVILSVKKCFGKFLTLLNSFSQNINSFLEGNRDVRCDDRNRVSIIYDLATGINNLFKKITTDERDTNKLNNELNNLKSVDPITLLNNLTSIHNIIEDRFEKHPNQALVLFDTGIYDEINDTFGEDVSNRLLEIVTQMLEDLELERVYLARLSKDKFEIFFEDFDAVDDLNEKLNELRIRLNSISRIDNLQVELKPNIVAVFRNDKIKSRYEWIRLLKDIYRETRTPEGSFKIYDFNMIDELLEDETDLFDNILEMGNEATEGFSRSKKTREE